MASNRMREQIGENLKRVTGQIADTALRVGRDPGEVTLVAVSKTHPLQAIEAAMEFGQFDFGENRFDEAWGKIRAAESAGLARRIRWHFIGSIQSRQSHRAIGPFVLVHSVDRLKVAQRISRDAEAASCVQSVLIEANVSGEGSKHGFSAAALLADMPALLDLPGLRLEGLMTMAPLVDDAEIVRPVFRSLRRLRDELTDRYGAALPQLSMGMSGDYQVAVEEGATLVRIGTAIFGERE